jgi:hypothetical protein
VGTAPDGVAEPTLAALSLPGAAPSDQDGAVRA